MLNSIYLIKRGEKIDNVEEIIKMNEFFLHF